MRHEYANLSGDSGVQWFEIGPTWIRVKFHDGEPYLYDHGTPGRRHVEEMKRRARAGHGLSTYISRHVRERYAGH